MLKRFFEFLLLRAKVSLQQMVIYRLASLMTVIFGVLLVFAEYLAIDVYYSFGETIAGWSEGDFFILFGTFNCMVHLYSFLFEIGHDDFSYKIRYGELDYDLVRPVNAQLLCSISRFDFPSLLNMIVPVYFIYLGVSRANVSLDVLTSMGFVMAFFFGTFVIYLLNHIVSTCSFWFTDLSSSLQLLNSVVNLGSKPLSIYPWVLQVIFGFCIPVILAANLPVGILLGKVNLFEVATLLVGTALLFVVSNCLWKKGLERYQSASS